MITLEETHSEFRKAFRKKHPEFQRQGGNRYYRCMRGAWQAKLRGQTLDPWILRDSASGLSLHGALAPSSPSRDLKECRKEPQDICNKTLLANLSLSDLGIKARQAPQKDPSV